jgi:hypothetical protein
MQKEWKTCGPHGNGNKNDGFQHTHARTHATSHSKSPVTIASWLGAPTKPKKEEEGKEEDKRENARGVWAGINRAALSMGCSNYGSLMPTVSASSKIPAANAAGSTFVDHICLLFCTLSKADNARTQAPVLKASSPVRSCQLVHVCNTARRRAPVVGAKLLSKMDLKRCLFAYMPV